MHMFGTPLLLVKANKGANGGGSTFAYPLTRLRQGQHALFRQERRKTATSRDANRASASRAGGIAHRTAVARAGRSEGAAGALAGAPPVSRPPRGGLGLSPPPAAARGPPAPSPRVGGNSIDSWLGPPKP